MVSEFAIFAQIMIAFGNVWQTPADFFFGGGDIVEVNYINLHIRITTMFYQLIFSLNWPLDPFIILGLQKIKLQDNKYMAQISKDWRDLESMSEF